MNRASSYLAFVRLGLLLGAIVLVGRQSAAAQTFSFRVMASVSDDKDKTELAAQKKLFEDAKNADKLVEMAKKKEAPNLAAKKPAPKADTAKTLEHLLGALSVQGSLADALASVYVAGNMPRPPVPEPTFEWLPITPEELKLLGLNVEALAYKEKIAEGRKKKTIVDDLKNKDIALFSSVDAKGKIDYFVFFRPANKITRADVEQVMLVSAPGAALDGVMIQVPAVLSKELTEGNLKHYLTVDIGPRHWYVVRISAVIANGQIVLPGLTPAQASNLVNAIQNAK